MEEKPYQNIDLPQSNPLDLKTTEDSEETLVKKTINPKILLLIILGAIIFVLLLLSLIVTQVRKTNSNLPSITPTPIPSTSTPINNDSLIPSPFQEPFKNLEQSFSQDPDLPIPQIDTQIGL
jgi:predicted PurR-regulated permease PerM